MLGHQWCTKQLETSVLKNNWIFKGEVNSWSLHNYGKDILGIEYSQTLAAPHSVLLYCFNNLPVGKTSLSFERSAVEKILNIHEAILIRSQGGSYKDDLLIF